MGDHTERLLFRPYVVITLGDPDESYPFPELLNALLTCPSSLWSTASARPPGELQGDWNASDHTAVVTKVANSYVGNLLPDALSSVFLSESWMHAREIDAPRGAVEPRPSAAGSQLVVLSK